MSDLPKMETTSFESSAMERRIPHYSRYRPFERPSASNSRSSARRTEDRTASMLTKLGVSAAVCALLLAVMFSDVPLIDRIAGNMETLLQTEVSPEETLGRLKFVNMPLIADVFQVRASYTLPIADGEVTKNESGALVVVGHAQCDVLAIDQGTVADTGLDDAQKGYVRIDHGDGLVSAYHGLSKVTVEKSQPLKKGDAIGRTGTNGKIEFTVTLNGEDQDAMALFGLKQN